MKPCAARIDIEQHFAGTITRARERALRQHLPDCASCRSYYERHVVLSQLDPMSLPVVERLGRGLGFGGGKRVPSAWMGAATGILALAAAIAVVVHSPGHDDAIGFTARGTAVQGPASHVMVYEVKAGGSTSLAGQTLRADEELAFAYENSAAKRKLMVFGVDEHRHVYWYFPAWTSEAENPVARPISTEPGRHALLEGVRQHLDGERLEMRSLFVDDALTVRDVEALLAAHPTGPLPIAGAVEATTVFAVVP